MRFKLSLILSAILLSCASDERTIAAATASGTTDITVGPQYDTAHVYVSPGEVQAFVSSFLGTFGGKSTKPVLVNVLPEPSSTTSQLLLTPVGTVSVFGFTTPIPAPFGLERTGYLVKNIEAALQLARAAGAEVFVTPFNDPIGRDALIRFPGGVNTQIYWHTTQPYYSPLTHIPENRVYVSPDGVNAFVSSFLRFSAGKITSDKQDAPGIEIGRPSDTYRRVRINSNFGKLTVLVTDGHLPYPHGRETTGYEVDHLEETLQRAKSLGVVVLAGPYSSDVCTGAVVQFPGGYIAEIHESIHQ